MKASEATLQELLGGPKQYQVPLYQRTYSWGETQLAQLWDDILALAEDLTAGQDGSHFMGSLVLAPSPGISPAIGEWLVVDGQQRLTTLSLMLCALRDHLAVEQPDQRDRVDELFLINKWSQGDGRYKLLPTQADRSVYLACVDARVEAGQNHGVGAAYRSFRSKLAASSRGDETVDMAILERAITAGLSFVVITAHADDNVHRIFESLNNTGVRLTQGDLLRNYFFMRLPGRSEEVYRSVWLPMQDMLSPDELELLLWLDLVLRGDPRAKRNDLYRAQMHRLEFARDEDALQLEIEELARRGRHLKTILDPSREADRSVRIRLQHLDSWGSQTTYPLLMHLLDLRERGQIDSDQVAVSMLYIESFLVRRMLAGRATNNLNRIFAAAANEMLTDVPIEEALRIYLSGQRRYWTTDNQLRETVRSHNFYWTGRAVQRSLLLRWVEESYGRKEVVQLDSLTIEHVMPQTLSLEWTDVLTEDVIDEAGPKELHAILVHTLGNLTLTGYNAELSNRPYAEKREMLAASGLAMNQEIAHNERWGREEIQARSDLIAERVIQAWPGPVEGVSDDESPTWALMEQILAALPPAAWTSYGDLAEVVGTHPIAVGARIGNTPTPNGHRVLNSQGFLSPQFRWYEPGRTDDPLTVLAAEGVTIDDHGRAHPAQRLTATNLADLIELERDPDASGSEPAEVDGERAAQFETQLAAQPALIVDAVRVLLDGWRHKGGGVSYGRARETSAILYYLPYGHRGHILWVAVAYPVSGTIEISFQHLKNKEPFTDPALREQLRCRLNEAPGIEISVAKIALRPSIRLVQLGEPGVILKVLEALSWLAEVAAADVPTSIL